jgi:hypothetical protein
MNFLSMKQHLGLVLVPLQAAAVWWGAGGPGFAMGTEKLGNEPVLDNPQWSRGVIAVVNLPSRVYTNWVNGNERFFYRGATAELNAALAKLGAVEAEVREVVLLPGPGETKTFKGARVLCDWQLQVPSGIYLHKARTEEGSRVFLRHARLTVFASGGGIELDEIEMPRGLSVLEEKDLTKRCIDGLKNADPTVRGQAAHLLGSTWGEGEGLLPLIELLRDPSTYPRLCAAGALAMRAGAAAAALPVLRENLEAQEGSVRQAFEEAIAEIEAAKGKEEKTDRAGLRRIGELVEKRGWLKATAGKEGRD